MSDATRQQRRREVREQIKAGRAVARQGAVAATQGRRDHGGGDGREGQTRRSWQSEPRQRSGGAGADSGRDVGRGPSAKVQKIACAKGCAYCCHTFVAITPPEAFRLADAVRAGRAAGMSAEVVRARGEPLVGVRPGERIGRKLACPLLVDGACSVYRHRPLACRQATSLDLARLHRRVRRPQSRGAHPDIRRLSQLRE